MKIKPLIRAIEVAANVVIVGSAAKSIYDKFKSSNDDDEDEDWEVEDSDSEDLDQDETGDDDEGAED